MSSIIKILLKKLTKENHSFKRKNPTTSQKQKAKHQIGETFSEATKTKKKLTSFREKVNQLTNPEPR